MFRYNTAAELGRLMVEAGIKIQNPYEPNSQVFDYFNESVFAAKNQKTDAERDALNKELAGI